MKWTRKEARFDDGSSTLISRDISHLSSIHWSAWDGETLIEAGHESTEDMATRMALSAALGRYEWTQVFTSEGQKTTARVYRRDDGTWTWVAPGVCRAPRNLDADHPFTAKVNATRTLKAKGFLWKGHRPLWVQKAC